MPRSQRGAVSVEEAITPSPLGVAEVPSTPLPSWATPPGRLPARRPVPAVELMRFPHSDGLAANDSAVAVDGEIEPPRPPRSRFLGEPPAAANSVGGTASAAVCGRSDSRREKASRRRAMPITAHPQNLGVFFGGLAAAQAIGVEIATGGDQKQLDTVAAVQARRPVASIENARNSQAHQTRRPTACLHPSGRENWVGVG